MLVLKMAKSNSKKGGKDKNGKKSVFALFALLVFFASTFGASKPWGTSAQLQSPSQISNAGYVEPGACVECHREIAESYARTGMARTFGAVRSESEFPELKRDAFRHDASEEFFSLYAGESGPQLKRHQAGFDGAATNIFEARIDY